MPGVVSHDNTLQPTSTASIKATKRKIDDALYNIDQALRSNDDVGRPPAKKMKFPGSLYSTLAKYGIKTKSRFTPSTKPGDLSLLSKTAPHLSAILSRAASRKEKEEQDARAAVASVITPTLQPSPVEYRPSSTASFLSRLSTFKLSTYSTKPSLINAVAAAKAGWINEGKERLLCGICKAAWVLASRDGLSKDAANSLIEKQRTQLVQMHKDACPWRAKQCDDSVYCIPLKAPSALAKELKSNALALDDKKVLEGIDIRHPLTTSQVQALLSALSSIKLTRPSVSETNESTAESQAAQGELTEADPSQKAALAAVFGWSLVPPTTEPRRASLSIAPATIISQAAADSISCALVLSGADRRTSWSSSISEAGSPRSTRIPVPRTSLMVTTRQYRQEAAKKRDDTLIHCALCQRRVGLWTFKGSGDSSPASPTLASPSLPNSTPSAAPPTSSISTTSNEASRLSYRRASQGSLPKRPFDLLKEHRSYCPYVVRSTFVPSLTSLVNSTPPARSFSASFAVKSARPTPSRSNSASSFNFSSLRGAPQHSQPESPGGLGEPAAVEGWRAVLTMVMRSGLGKRHRASVYTRGLRPSSDSHAAESQPEGPGSSPLRTSIEDNDPMEIEDGIQRMVDDVKKHGGKDLIRYVKNLFK